MTEPYVINVDVRLADTAKITGFVFEQDGLWFRRHRADARWHLTKPHGLRSWCGLELNFEDLTMSAHVTWPWLSGGCWSCMDRRWKAGVR